MVTQEEFDTVKEIADRSQSALVIAVIALGQIRNNGWTAAQHRRSAENALAEMQGILTDSPVERPV